MTVNRSVHTDPQPGATLPQLMNAQDVAEILGIAKKTVHKLVRDGRLGCVEITETDRRFTIDQVQNFIEAQTVAVRIDKPRGRAVESPPQKGGGTRRGKKSTEAQAEGSLVKELKELCH